MNGPQTPQPRRPVLAGPPPTVLYLLAVMAVLAAAALLIARAGRRPARTRAARFASRGDLSELRVRGPEAGRVTLGIHHRANDRLRAACLGDGRRPLAVGQDDGRRRARRSWSGTGPRCPRRSRATSSTTPTPPVRHGARCRLRPHRLDQAAPRPLVADRRRALPGRARGAPPPGCLGVGEHGPARSADETFWRPAGARFLAPLLLAAAHGDLTMREVLSWIATVNEDEPTALLDRHSSPGAQPALEALQSVWEAEDALSLKPSADRRHRA